MSWDWLKAPVLQDLLAALRDARVAGGAVRNALLGAPVHEVDVATPLSPQQVMELSAAAGFSVHPTGLAHGTVTVAREGAAFEVTTLRHDVETDGRRAKVSFTDDWQADAQRRDFTMNALYCSASGEVFDLVSGMADLQARRVRFVGEPAKRIAEDYLRILRFFRFHAQYGEGELDGPGLAACGALKAGLVQLSAERVRQELLKLIVARGAVEAVRAMEACGILDLILPGARTDVFARMAAIDLAEGFAPDAVLRLAALSAQADLRSRLRLSNPEAERLEAMQAAPDFSPALREAERRRVLYALGATLYRDVVRLCWAREGDGDWRGLHALADEWPVPVFPVKGADLLACGLKAGPELGQTLRALEDWWVASDFTATKQALIARVQGGQANG